MAATLDEPTNAEDVTNVEDIAARLGISLDTPVDNTPPPADAGSAGEPPVPAGDKPAPEKPPVSSNAEGAARRVAEKNKQKELTQELETTRARLQELEALSAKLPEVEKREAEFRTLAEQREADLKAYTERYQNEVNTLDPALLPEIPEVRAAQDRYNEVAAKFIPEDISNPNDDEMEMRVNPANLSDRQLSDIKQQIAYWKQQEFDSKSDPGSRAMAQLIAISNIAATLGVDPNKFTPKAFGKTEYNVIPTSHPVYQHLKTHIRQLVDAQQQVAKANQSAMEGKVQALETVKSGRMTNTKKMMEQVGLGLTGEALDAALQKSPDNMLLQTMKALEGEPELFGELKKEMEMEILVNGHMRPHLDLVDPDPKAYHQKAQAMYTRIGQRAIHAPLTLPLMKLTLKQRSRIEELQTELEAVKAERDKTLIQNEPGGLGSAGASTPPSAYSDPDLGRVAAKLGLA